MIYKVKMKNIFGKIIFITLVALSVGLIWGALHSNPVAMADSSAGTNIRDSAGNYWAWNDIIGWMDFHDTHTIIVGPYGLTGYASSSFGEVSLDCHTTSIGNICGTSNYQVLNDGNGNLSGWGWNDQAGWISFCGGQQTADCPGTISYKVNVNLTTGYFSGWAWNDAIGWISFNCADAGLCGVADYKVAVAVASGWRYLGPDGTSLTFYVPTGSGIPSQITLKYHNNHRYSRYKIILSPDSGHTLTPTVDDAIINWSP